MAWVLGPVFGAVFCRGKSLSGYLLPILEKMVDFFENGGYYSRKPAVFKRVEIFHYQQSREAHKMNTFKFSKIVPAALPSLVALSMVALMPSVASASAHAPGLVYDDGNKPVLSGSGGCVRTTRWRPELGACGEGTGAAVAMPAEDAREDSMMPRLPRDGLLPDSRIPADRVQDGLLSDAVIPDPVITVPGVQFEFDSAELQDTARVTLDEAAAMINRADVRSVEVTGHTDSTGPEVYNQFLSERRADSVKSYLEGRGVTNIEARGVGESQPIADNASREGRAKNRRVEVDVNL